MIDYCLAPKEITCKIVKELNILVLFDVDFERPNICLIDNIDDI